MDESESYGLQKNRRVFMATASVAAVGLGVGAAVRWMNRPIVHSKAVVSPKPEPVILPHEKDYAEFIATLGLRFISPREVVMAHRRERNGVRNSLPPRELWRAMVPTLKVADELRLRLGCKLSHITSAYRSSSYNACCPGTAKNSYHTKNRALDLVYDCSPKEAMREAKAMRAQGRFQGGLGLYNSFIHIDTRGRNATWG